MASIRKGRRVRKPGPNKQPKQPADPTPVPRHRKSVEPALARSRAASKLPKKPKQPKEEGTAQVPKHAWWTIPRCWEGQDAFVICGGTSVTDEQLEMARHGNTICVNSAFKFAPWSDYLFFADMRWWTLELKNVVQVFEGSVITTSGKAMGFAKLHKLKRTSPGPGQGMGDGRQTVCLRRTSAHSAIEIAFKMGAARIFLLGIDNRGGEGGRDHRHEEYPWVRRSDQWTPKVEDLKHLAEELKKHPVEVYNCSPISTLKYWPKVNLEDYI